MNYFLKPNIIKHNSGIRIKKNANGFKLYKTEEQDGALFFDYIKNKTIVTLCSGIDENEYGYKKPYYEISVKKP